MSREGGAWKRYLEKQQVRIERRLNRYSNMNTVKDQLKETGDLSPYQKYKINTVSKYLIKALQKIKNNTYGICEVCKEEIDIARLDVVPAALTCVKCDSLKEEAR